MLIANSNLVPQWATWEHFRELDAAGLMMYGQMTAGSWIYIGTQGILQGTYETFAAVARKRFGGTLRGPARGHRRARRDGRRAAARGHDVRRRRAVHRGRPHAHRAAASQTRLPRRARRRPRRRARAPAGAPRRAARRCRSACSATPPRCCPSSCAAACTSTSSPTRPRAHDPLNGYVPAGLTAGAGRRAARERSRRVPAPGRRERARPRRRDPRAAAGAAPRRSTTATRCAGVAPTTATRTRSTTPASSPPTSGRCSARARARSAGSRCPATRTTSRAPTRRSSTCSATRSTSRRWIELAQRARAVPGAAGADLLARLRRAPPRRPALQRDGRLRRAVGADRDRPRPPRRRLGRLAPARDRGDARRLATPSPTGRS